MIDTRYRREEYCYTTHDEYGRRVFVFSDEKIRSSDYIPVKKNVCIFAHNGPNNTELILMDTSDSVTGRIVQTIWHP